MKAFAAASVAAGCGGLRAQSATAPAGFARRGAPMALCRSWLLPEPLLPGAAAGGAVAAAGAPLRWFRASRRRCHGRHDGFAMAHCFFTSTVRHSSSRWPHMNARRIPFSAQPSAIDIRRSTATITPHAEDIRHTASAY